MSHKANTYYPNKESFEQFMRGAELRTAITAAADEVLRELRANAPRGNSPAGSHYAEQFAVAQSEARFPGSQPRVAVDIENRSPHAGYVEARTKYLQKQVKRMNSAAQSPRD